MDPGSRDRAPVVVLGTLDTKAEPIAYLATRVAEAGCPCMVMDVGVGAPGQLTPNVPAKLMAAGPEEAVDALRHLPRGEAVEHMSRMAAARLAALVAANEVFGVVGVGGSGGTTICAAAMRGLPYGLPKILVSTLASGNTRWHVDISDIVMMPSIVDVAGRNPLLDMVLGNAAHAVAGMARAYRSFSPSGKRVVGVTMYGTTTTGVSRAARRLEEAGLEPWTFHASGVGGRTMEELVGLGYIDATLDMTLAEVGAHLVGGLHDGGPGRLDAAGIRGLPQVIVPGAADTVALPPRGQIPDRFRRRTLNDHNPTMTTMRTNPEENVAIGHFIAGKLNRARGPVVVVLPLGGLSSIDRPGAIFHDPVANDALFHTLRAELDGRVRILEDSHHIDDPAFADRVADLTISLLCEAKEGRGPRDPA